MLATPVEQRVLLVGVAGDEGDLMCRALEDSDIVCTPLAEDQNLARELHRGAGTLIIVEEELRSRHEHDVSAFVRNQPGWSDLPIFVLTSSSTSSPKAAQLVDLLGNVSLIERPIRIPVFISTVRAALRARMRQHELRAQIAERIRIADALRETDRRKDEFLAALAHELRNPLAPLSNTLHLLRSRGEKDAEERRAHDVMRRQVQHLTRLVDDLLDVSRITRGKVSLQREMVDLRAVVRSAVETSRPVIEANGHTLELALPDEPVQLHGDPVRLAQAISNLLNNAAKYTPAGGLIRLNVERDSGCAVIRVIDNGIGIAEAALPHVFDLFMQEDESSGRAQGGLGIGLTLVRTFVHLHGGEVCAFSAGPDQGSEFVIRLPAMESAREASKESDDTASIPRQPHRILIVDDNEDGAQSLAMLLELQGNVVAMAYDGPQAVKTVGEFHPDVVLLDIGLPTINGYDTARLMREHPDSRDALIIALTGWGQEEHRRRSREAGFDHHLVKPVDMRVLEGLLASSRPALH
jgi:signal transduction histidine kinase/ActR/RegA family two-component response regulator